MCIKIQIMYIKIQFLLKHSYNHCNSMSKDSLFLLSSKRIYHNKQQMDRGRKKGWKYRLIYMSPTKITYNWRTGMGRVVLFLPAHWRDRVSGWNRYADVGMLFCPFSSLCTHCRKASHDFFSHLLKHSGQDKREEQRRLEGFLICWLTHTHTHRHRHRLT